MTKEKVIEMVNGLPDQFNLDELMERLVFIDKVEKGMEQIKNGETTSHTDVKKMVDKWRK